MLFHCDASFALNASVAKERSFGHVKRRFFFVCDFDRIGSKVGIFFFFFFCFPKQDFRRKSLRVTCERGVLAINFRLLAPLHIKKEEENEQRKRKRLRRERERESAEPKSEICRFRQIKLTLEMNSKPVRLLFHSVSLSSCFASVVWCSAWLRTKMGAPDL